MPTSLKYMLDSEVESVSAQLENIARDYETEQEQAAASASKSTTPGRSLFNPLQYRQGEGEGDMKVEIHQRGWGYEDDDTRRSTVVHHPPPPSTLLHHPPSSTIHPPPPSTILQIPSRSRQQRERHHRRTSQNAARAIGRPHRTARAGGVKAHARCDGLEKENGREEGGGRRAGGEREGEGQGAARKGNGRGGREEKRKEKKEGCVPAWNPESQPRSRGDHPYVDACVGACEGGFIEGHAQRAIEEARRERLRVKIKMGSVPILAGMTIEGSEGLQAPRESDSSAYSVIHSVRWRYITRCGEQAEKVRKRRLPSIFRAT
ncbi:hypothetical protein C8R45DRAFT_934159 [Mycena sanguinolenta]|nr:hypothetical protein C8R45DRAFT_934159 [Mycena sanguinolenta]